MERNKLKVFDILKEALTIYSKNISFAIITFLTSLPLFCFLVYHEAFLQNFLLQTSQNFQPKERPSSDFSFYITTPSIFDDLKWSLPLDIVRNLNKDLFHELLQLGFLYLVPLQLLLLCTVLVTVDLASKIYSGEKALSFKDMLHIRVDGARLRGTFITFLYVVFLSTCTLLGFIWLLITYSAVLRYFPSQTEFMEVFVRNEPFGFDVSLHLLFGSNLLLLVIIYLAWSAIWNLGLVISVLEGIYGVKALGSAAFLGLRNAQNGLLLMLVFSVWGLGLRLPCLSFGCYKTRLGIYIQIGLFCLGNALKWVSFVVYFQDCVRQVSGKKVGQEQG
ncbi:Transmembrane protein [Trema orientale]|uniref:Transmembrane protein n=1 Tax=Trema orientale TaxID=63057 RepID=A0A2P5FM94_TREOI|nr:Transmembrane protein [Trema orientale]